VYYKTWTKIIFPKEKHFDNFSSIDKNSFSDNTQTIFPSLEKPENVAILWNTSTWLNFELKFEENIK